MSNNLREQAIEGYLQRDDGLDWKGLMDYANKMFTARDSLTVEETPFEFDADEARKLFQDQKVFLREHPLNFDPIQFRKNLQTLQDKFIEENVINEPAQIDQLKRIDWEKLSDETIAAAGKDPSELFERANAELGIDPEDAESQAVLAGLFINLLRAYLRPVGKAMSESLETLDEVSVRDKPKVCPTCGSVPSISSVREVKGTQSNERQLFCSCCGTVWPFERVRCAICGNTNSNKLKYYYADQDPAHRLHVCDVCSGTMPTVFQTSMKGAMDYDIELIAMGVVQNLFQDQIVEKKDE